MQNLRTDVSSDLLFRVLLTLALTATICFVCSCRGDDRASNRSGGGSEMRITLTSEAFRDGGTIPDRYGCDGQGMSPPLRWEGVPAGTKSLALICDDPDAPRGTFTHWVLYNLPPETKRLPENIPHRERLDDGSLQGVNSARRIGYTPPCPPTGTHRYIFTLYALDTQPDLKPAASKSDLLRAMEGHILAQGQITGTYSR